MCRIKLKATVCEAAQPSIQVLCTYKFERRPIISVRRLFNGHVGGFASGSTPTRATQIVAIIILLMMQGRPHEQIFRAFCTVFRV